ncbi:MAG: nuclear transport factor 2 family protein [Acidobacteria bacterium]|nr:nuclear transport factor 2 family protein [Acidobacteriota bacterium]
MVITFWLLMLAASKVSPPAVTPLLPLLAAAAPFVQPETPAKPAAQANAPVPQLQPMRLVDRGKLTDEERQTLEVIEIYRAEHTMWNLDRLRSIFADNPTIWKSDQISVGRDAVDKTLADWAAKGKLRRHMVMRYGLIMVRGNFAAAEWVRTGEEPDGKSLYLVGTNIYELEGGKIKYLSIYVKQ